MGRMSGITYYLAVDIGASSGRHILGWMDKGKIRMEEIYRFENKLEKRNGHLCWDLDHLFHEVVEGMRKCKELDRIPASVGIDTWGVDFVLLDANGNVLGNTVAYRDGRTKGMDEEVYKVISESELYGRNGIQKQLFNSIYQLMAIKKETPQLLERGMLPDDPGIPQLPPDGRGDERVHKCDDDAARQRQDAGLGLRAHGDAGPADEDFRRAQYAEDARRAALEQYGKARRLPDECSPACDA